MKGKLTLKGSGRRTPASLRAYMRQNLVAYLALFVALGGTSYAAIKLPANSVGASQIRKDAVRSSEVKDSSLVAADFKPGHVPAGARGPHGPRGQEGARGPVGAPGAAIVARVRSTGGAATAEAPASVPLASNSWTQPAGHVDLLPFGQITYTAPSATSCQGVGFATLRLTIYVDGKPVSTDALTTSRDGGTRTASVGGPKSFLFDPATASSHTATAEVTSGCTEPIDERPRFTIGDLRFNVIRAA